jgi:hypothetical protein
MLRIHAGLQIWILVRRPLQKIEFYRKNMLLVIPYYQMLSYYSLVLFNSPLFFLLSVINLTLCPQGIFYVWILGLATALIIHLLEHWHHFYTNKI